MSGSTVHRLPTRRQVLAGGAAVAAVGVTAACSSGGGGSPAAAVSGTTVPVSSVPVGGGVVLTDQQVVVTQPTAGTFRAFSAVCTHAGCLVTTVAAGVITCPCHQGLFSAADGSVTGGPPPSPLPSVPLTVSGSTITLG